jgi:hypothetical protein
MASTLRNLAIIADNPIHESILLIDSTTPETGQISFEGFRLPGTNVGIT